MVFTNQVCTTCGGKGYIIVGGIKIPCICSINK